MLIILPNTYALAHVDKHYAGQHSSTHRVVLLQQVLPQHTNDVHSTQQQHPQQQAVHPSDIVAATQGLPASIIAKVAIAVTLQNLALGGLVAFLRVVVHQEVCQQAGVWM